ncbi:hypothetical protein HYW76_02280 [Candidatus Pacearchaeota archaeon]|nr:hypothetical protein [Candidatus Pacearchaeota archaeon]
MYRRIRKVAGKIGEYATETKPRKVARNAMVMTLVLPGGSVIGPAYMAIYAIIGGGIYVYKRIRRGGKRGNGKEKEGEIVEMVESEEINK